MERLENHILRAHSKSIKCEKCGNCFIHQKYLEKHMKIEHRDAEYPCSDCGKCFTKAKKLRVHIERAHIKVRIMSFRQGVK